MCVDALNVKGNDVATIEGHCLSVWAVPFILCINILFSLHGNTGEGPHPCCPSPRHSSNHSSIMHLMKGYQGEPFLKHSGKKRTTTHKGHNVSEGEVRRLLSARDHSVVKVPPLPPGCYRHLAGHNDAALCDKPLKPMYETR